VALRQPRILIVDDSISLLETLADIVRLAGFDVTTAADGTTGAVRLGEFRPDVAIIDIVLPDRNGVDLVREALHERPDTKFIIITGYTEDAQVAAARALSGVKVLHKPVDPGQLVELLRSMTGLGR